jgi:predicted nucleotidyltransferase
MKPSTALALHRLRIRELVAAHRSRGARVFGSASRGQDREGSDLDLLVDPQPGATLLDLGALQVELEALLGVPVDLRTAQDLPAGWRDEVLRHSVPV